MGCAGLQLCTYLVEQLLACGVGLDGKLQLRVHSGDANIDLHAHQPCLQSFIAHAWTHTHSHIKWYNDHMYDDPYLPLSICLNIFVLVISANIVQYTKET